MLDADTRKRIVATRTAPPTRLIRPRFVPAMIRLAPKRNRTPRTRGSSRGNLTRETRARCAVVCGSVAPAD